MPTMLRIIFFIIVLLIVFGGIFFAFRFFNEQNLNGAQTLAITSQGKFASSSKKINNDQQFRFKNESNKTQTVKTQGTNQTLVDIEPNSLSKLIVLKKDTNYSFYLASDNKQKATLTVGSPKTTTTNETKTNPTPPAAVAPPTTQPVLGTSSQNTQPLPNTGPGESYLLPLLGVVGFILLKFSKFFWRKAIR